MLMQWLHSACFERRFSSESDVARHTMVEIHTIGLIGL